jgi:hypothetical protein
MIRPLLLPLLLLPLPVLAADIACPEAITTPLGPEALPGWTAVARPSPTGFPHHGPDQTGRRPFDRLSVVDGPPSDIQAEAPGTLAPDEGAAGHGRGGTLRQRWDLSAGSPRGFLMVCHYQGTATLLFRVLPAGVRECRQSLPLDARGGVAPGGPRSAACG